MKLIKTAGLKFFPGAVINNVTFWGTLNGPNVFEEVCSSLEAPPQFCGDYETHGEMMFHLLKPEESTSILRIILVSALVLTIFFVFLFYFYRRWAKLRM